MKNGQLSTDMTSADSSDDVTDEAAVGGAGEWTTAGDGDELATRAAGGDEGRADGRTS